MLSRRDLFAGASALAVSVGIPVAALDARSLHGGGAANNLLTAKSLISGFDLNEGASYAFINFAKNLGSMGGDAGFNFVKYMNSDGYPNALYTGQSFGWSSIMQVDAAILDPSVTWVIDWQGKGGIQISNNASGNTFTFTNIGGGTTANGTVGTPITGNLVVSGTNGYAEFTNAAGASAFKLAWSQFLAYDGTMSNLRLYRKTDKTALVGGAIFTPEFISYMKALNPKVIRTMDWTSTNFSNSSSFVNRCQTTAFSYFNTQYFSALYTEDLTHTNTYVCAAPSGWGGLVDGATVQVYLANGNGATASTLNVGGTGAIPMIAQSNFPTLPIPAGTVVTCVYDLWLNAWVSNTTGVSSTMPWELIVALCNQLNMHCWINIPFYFTNAAVTSLVTMIRGSLNSNLNCYLEYTNEHWNFFFANFTMCQARGNYLGFPNASGRQENGYYGLRVRQIMDLATAAWSPRSLSTLRRVMAVGAGNDPPSVKLYQFDGADLQTGIGYTNYDSAVAANYHTGSPTWSRPIDICDVVSYATYYDGAVFSSGYAMTELNTTDVSGMTNATDANDLTWMDNQLRKGTRNTVTCSLPSALATNTITVANRFVNVSGDNSNVIIMSSSGAMPTGLTANQVYYAVNRTSTTFQVSATNGGSPLTISGGTGTLTVGTLGAGTLLWFLNLTYPAWEAAISPYDGARNSGMSNLVVECYEGAFQSFPPYNNLFPGGSSDQCAAMSISSSYGDSVVGNVLTNGSIGNYIINYKNSALAKQIVQDQFTQFTGYSPRNITPAWFSPFGPNQWALTPGSVLTTPFQTYQGIANYNAH